MTHPMPLLRSLDPLFTRFLSFCSLVHTVPVLLLPCSLVPLVPRPLLPPTPPCLKRETVNL